MPAIIHQSVTTIELTEDELHAAVVAAARAKGFRLRQQPHESSAATVHLEGGTTRVRFTTDLPSPPALRPSEKPYPTGPLPGGPTPRVNPGHKATYSGPGCADCKGADMSRGGEGPGCSTCARARGMRR